MPIIESRMKAPVGTTGAGATGAPFHVVLYEPEIPPNTGNIIRLCANTGATLHLVEPLGFAWEDRRLRRAGLDYHEFAAVRIHAGWEPCLAALGPCRILAFSSKAARPFQTISFQTGDALLFGPETRGLPATLLEGIPPEHRLRLPMRPEQRSLNLSNACAVALFEAWRQLGYPGGA